MVVSTHLKNIGQIWSFPQVGVKKNNIWNHHPDSLPPPVISGLGSYLATFMALLSEPNQLFTGQTQGLGRGSNQFPKWGGVVAVGWLGPTAKAAEITLTPQILAGFLGVPREKSQRKKTISEFLQLKNLSDIWK